MFTLHLCVTYILREQYINNDKENLRNKKNRETIHYCLKNILQNV